MKQNTDDGIARDINFWCPPRVHCALVSVLLAYSTYWLYKLGESLSWSSLAVPEMTDVEIAAA